MDVFQQNSYISCHLKINFSLVFYIMSELEQVMVPHMIRGSHKEIHITELLIGNIEARQNGSKISIIGLVGERGAQTKVEDERNECLPTHTRMKFMPFPFNLLFIYLFVIYTKVCDVHCNIEGYSLHESLYFVLLRFFSCQKLCTFSFFTSSITPFFKIKLTSVL